MNCQFCGRRAVHRTMEVSDLFCRGDERREQHHFHCEGCGLYRVTGTVKDGYTRISEAIRELLVAEIHHHQGPLITSSLVNSMEERIEERE